MGQKKGLKSIKKNFVFYAFKSAMAVIFPLISFPYASRVLGVNGIGMVQYATSVISYFALFAALGIGTYAIREGVKVRNDREKFSKLAKEIFLINVISTIIVYLVLLAALAAGLFVDYEIVMLISGLTILCTTLSVEWIYQAEEEYVFISVRTMVVQVISLILMFLLVRDSSDVNEYAFILTFASGAHCIFNLAYAKKYVDLNIKCSLNFKQHIKPIFVIFGNNVASSIYLNLDSIMIGVIYGDYQLGLYTVAVKIMTLLRSVINSVSTVLMPRLSYYVETEQRDQYLLLLRKGVQLNLIFAIPCTAGIIGLSENIILIFSGADYLGAMGASCILAFNLIFATLDNLIYFQILIPHRQEKQGCKGTILGAVSNLILNAILIPGFMIEGAAVATLLAELAVFVYFMSQTRKVLPVKYLFSETYKLLLSACGVCLVIYFVKKYVEYMLLEVMISVILSVIVYFGLLIVLKYSVVIDELKQRIHLK